METSNKVSIFITGLLLITCASQLCILNVRAEEISPLSYSGNWCLRFDGVDDYVSCGYSDIFQVENFTIETWIKPTHTIQVGSNSLYGRSWGVVASRTNPGINGICLEFHYNTGLLYLYITIGGTDVGFYTDKSVWYNSSWYHIAVMYDRSLPSNNVKFYVNGTIDSQHSENRSITNDNGPLQIGRLSSNIYGGFIDEFRIWNVSRTQAEIQETWARTLNDTETVNPNLVGYWRFDEGTGLNSVDQSIYGHDAALAASPATPQWISQGAPIVPEFPALHLVIFLIAVGASSIVLPQSITRKSKVRSD